MSTTYVSAALRRRVAALAEGICEYCLIAEDDTFFGCAIDHIISEKHDGATRIENLALACVFCTQAKGSDIGSIHSKTGQFVRFFNPRADHWAEHFVLKGHRIEGRTPIGIVTAKLLRFNVAERLLERKTLIQLSLFPSVAALRRIQGTLPREQRKK